MTAPVRLDASTASALVDTRLIAPGIHCAGCISKIERGLAEIEGVETVRVNFSTKHVAVRHVAELPESTLIDALEKLGFEAQTLADNPLAIDDKESRSLLRALAVAGFGMMNIMLLSVSVWSGAGGVTRELFHWLSALIAIPVIAYSGRPFFSSAWMALKYRRTNMDVPISIGVLLATALSLYETFAGSGDAYFDSAVMLLFFLLAGRALDAMMRKKTRSGIGALLSRMGKTAQVIQSTGGTTTVNAQDLEQGMLMLVAAGESLAADGVIEKGEGAIDNAMLTGESVPEAVGTGSQVHAGAVALEGPFEVRITAAAADTVLAEIARLMDDAGQGRSRYVRIADRAARLYAPAVHSLALLAFIGWMLAGAGWHQSLVIAIAVLIITCPCAMGLAVPAAQVVASGALIKRGLLVKDGSALERLAEVDIALFDKTGTLTLGEPRADISALGEQERAIALALAQSSRHPLSRGLAATLREGRVTPADVVSVEEIEGRGLSGLWQGQPVALTKPKRDQSMMATSLSVGSRDYVIHFTDALRADAAATIGALEQLGIESQIVSGDKAGAVNEIASTLGIKARAQARPQDKLELLDDLRKSGHRALMVGDGMNDGPALAAAHASIAPGTASDVSQQAADAVFTGHNLMPVAFAVRHARRCMTIVRQNFGFAVIYNACAVPLALAGLVTPLIAAIAMSASSLVVVGNSLRLARLQE